MCIRDRVYLVTPSPLLEEAIGYLSGRLGLKVVLCSGFSKKCRCDVFLKDLGPDEILSYIVNASFVLSGSFHATVFSILFGKRFATLLPDEKTNERIEDLLSCSGLPDRIIRDEQMLGEHLFTEPEPCTEWKDRIEFSKERLQRELEI